MSFVNDLFLDLPDEIKRLIVTQYLNGQALSNARCVSKDWYSYFNQCVWRDPTIRTALKANLEANWKNEIFTSTDEYWMLDEDCTIGAVAQDYLALTSPFGTQLEDVKITIFQLSTSNTWAVQDIFDSVLRTAKRNVYEIELSDKLMAIKVELREVGIARSHKLMVWKIDKRKKIIDKQIENLQTYQVSCNEDDQELLILHGESLEVWDLSGDYQILKVEALEISHSVVSDISFVPPYIVQVFSHPLTGMKMVKVWKYNREPLRLQKHLQIDDFDGFVHENGTKSGLKSIEILYFQNFFLVTCNSTLVAGEDEISVFSLKMIGNDGNILRECFMPQIPLNADVIFYPFYGRVMISMNRDVFLFENFNEDLDEDENRQIQLKKVKSLDGGIDLFFKHSSCSAAQIIVFDDGHPILNVQTMDFWKNIRFRMTK